MRLPLTIGAIAALLAGLLLTMPAAHAQDNNDNSPYPYFRRTSSSSSQPGTAAPQAGTPASRNPTVGLSLETDRSEAFPGGDVRYWIRARNLSVRDLPSWKVAFFFDRNQLQIIDASNARGDGDHLTFTVPSMRSNEERTFTVRVRLRKGLVPGTVVRAYGSMIWDGSISPACSRNDLRIIERVPVTGIGDATRPVEDLRRFLRPM